MVIMPVIAASVGTLLAVMLGMALNKLNGINDHLEQLNGKFYTHVTTPDAHEAGFARTDERINSLIKVMEAMHSRVDKLSGG